MGNFIEVGDDWIDLDQVVKISQEYYSKIDAYGIEFKDKDGSVIASRSFRTAQQATDFVNDMLIAAGVMTQEARKMR